MILGQHPVRGIAGEDVSELEVGVRQIVRAAGRLREILNEGRVHGQRLRERSPGRFDVALQEVGMTGAVQTVGEGVAQERVIGLLFEQGHERVARGSQLCERLLRTTEAQEGPAET